MAVSLEQKQKAEENMKGVDIKLHCICKNICNTAKFKKDHVVTTRHKDAFRNGFFRCRKCEYYIKDQHYCPCCGTRLATSPRNARCKRALKMEIGRY